MTPAELTDAELDQLAADLAPRLPTGTHGDRVILPRRAFMGALGGAVGVSGLMALGVDEAAAQAAGQVGTSSEPVDMYAYDLNVANQMTSSLPMGGNDIENAGSVSTGRLTIDGDAGRVYSDSTETAGISANSTGQITLSGMIPPTVLFSGFLTSSISIESQANSVACRSWQVIFRNGEVQSDPVDPTLQNNIAATLDTVTVNADGDLTIDVSNNSSFNRSYNFQAAAYGVKTQ